MLTRVLFTGVDGYTDFKCLLELQREFPKVEFGLRFSGDFRERRNGFFNPLELHKLKDAGLNLCCCLYGRLAEDALKGDYDTAKTFINFGGKDQFSLFRRILINTNGPIPDLPVIPDGVKQVVFRKGNATGREAFLRKKRNVGRVGVLIDGSAESGVESSITPIRCFNEVGYAGGFSPYNVASKVAIIESSPDSRKFWVEIGQRIHTVTGQFDIDAVRTAVTNLRYKGSL